MLTLKRLNLSSPCYKQILLVTDVSYVDLVQAHKVCKLRLFIAVAQEFGTRLSYIGSGDYSDKTSNVYS